MRIVPFLPPSSADLARRATTQGARAETMAQFLVGRAVTHLVAFGVGALALRLVRDRRAPSEADDEGDEDEDDEVEDEDEDDEDDEDDDENLARQQRLAGYVVRDGYVAEAAADETFKMLLLCNMELYRTSSKTGEMKAVKMSSP